MDCLRQVEDQNASIRETVRDASVLEPDGTKVAQSRSRVAMHAAQSYGAVIVRLWTAKDLDYPVDDMPNTGQSSLREIRSRSLNWRRAEGSKARRA